MEGRPKRKLSPTPKQQIRNSNLEARKQRREERRANDERRCNEYTEQAPAAEEQYDMAQASVIALFVQKCHDMAIAKLGKTTAAGQVNGFTKGFNKAVKAVSMAEDWNKAMEAVTLAEQFSLNFFMRG